MRYQNEAGEYVDAVTVFPGGGSAVSTLVLKSDEERTAFRSYLYLDRDFPNTTAATIFQVKNWVTSLWVSPAGIHFLCGIHGEVWEQAATDFTMTKPSPVTLHAIWGTSDTDLVVTGDNGTVLRGARGAWTDISIQTDAAIYNVHIGASGLMAAVGQRGGFYLFVRGAWTTIDLATNVHMRGVTVLPNDDIYICGDHGLCYRYRGGELTRLEARDRTYFNVHPFKGRIYFAAGVLGLDVLSEDAVVDFQPKAGAVRLNTCGSYLWVCNDNRIFRYDGAAWLMSTFV